MCTFIYIGVYIYKRIYKKYNIDQKSPDRNIKCNQL